MPSQWETFVDTLIAGGKQIAKDELKILISLSKEDANDFIRSQGEKLERYLDLLAAGQITKEEFELLVKDLKDLTEMRALELQVAAKASAQRLVAGVTKLIIEGLLKLV
ncbi:MAG: hypothetical protein HY347_07785 [candidate division NC10 bacterium]|nr:hypothetical protein [candidate division NC10 bacterium]